MSANAVQGLTVYLVRSVHGSVAGYRPVFVRSVEVALWRK